MSKSELSGSITDEFSWDVIRMALKSEAEGIYEWDIVSGSIKYSRHCSELLGIKEGSSLPNIFTDWEHMIVEEDQTHFANHLRRYLESHTDFPFRSEARFYNPSRTSWRWLRVTGIATRKDGGHAIRLVGALVDITRRKTAEAQLEEERHLFRLLIDHIPDNIFFKNRESRFVVANASTAKKMGVPTPSDLIGKTDAYFFDTEKAKEWRQEEIRIMESNEPSVASVRKETWKTGEKSWCVATKIPWRGKDNQLKGILGITSDVTSMVEAQNALKKVAAELELKNQAFEKEIRLAREVQLALLPNEVAPFVFETEKVTRRLEFSNEYQPSGGVAGDWFEVLPITESTVGIFICDVMGHGVRSALVASMIRGLLEEAVKENPMPAAFLTHVNANLAKILARSEATMFATSFYMLIDLECNKAIYASAGHPSPFLCDPSTQFVGSLEVPRGIALGLIEEVAYTETSLELKDGMGFLLFTDGLIEATNKAGEELGATRLRQYFEKDAIGSAITDVDKVLQQACQFMGCETFDDDICLLSVKYMETPCKT